MVINYKFKHFGKITDNRNRFVTTHSCTVSFFFFFLTGKTTACFKRVRKLPRDKLRLEINLRTGIKISEQVFTIKPGQLSSSTEFEGRRCLMAL
jgi:hypothetical protein